MRPKWLKRNNAPLLWCDLSIGQPGIVVHNELLLSGWAASSSGIASVAVGVDDDWQLLASYGLETPWVAEAMPEVPGADRAGYRLRLDTSQWRAGTHEIAIVATDAKGRRNSLTGQVEVLHFAEPHYTLEENLTAISEGKPVMWLESPRVVEGVCRDQVPVEVSGWAFSESGVDSVVVTIDKVARFDALRPISRPDLIGDYGAAVAGEAGFVLPLHATELPPGRHSLSVVATARDGQAVGMEGDVICLPEPTTATTADGEQESPQIEWYDETTVPQIRQNGIPVRYDPDRHKGLPLEAEHQLRYRWASTIAAGQEVLDAGCGAGWGTALLAAAGAQRTVGIDSSEEALADARRRTGETAELIRGDLCELPFDDASFDLVVCFDEVGRIADPDVALEELRRVLRPNGVLLISVPQNGRSPGDNGVRQRTLTSHELEQALRGRFDEVRIHRQHSGMSSTILDEEGFSTGDGDVDLKVDVRKLSVGRPGGEEHTVAIAGGGPLPELGRMTMLASAKPVRDAIENAVTWMDRARLAEAEVAATRIEANLAQMHQKGAVAMLREAEARAERAEALQSSLSWRVSHPLWLLKAAGRRLRTALGRG